MQPCERYTDLISASLDSALCEREQSELDAHLAACPACSALYAQLTQLHEACAELEELAAPGGFAAGVMERIRADAAQEQPHNVIPFPAKKTARSLWKRWGVTAAAVAIVVLGAITLPGQPGGKNASMDMAAREVADTAAPADHSLTAESAVDVQSIRDASTGSSAPITGDTKPDAEAPAAEPVPAPTAQPQTNQFDAGPTTSAESDAVSEPGQSASTDRGTGAPYCGTLTFSAADAPAGLEEYEYTVSEDGSKAYTVPADVFFTLEGSEACKELSVGGAEYGLVIVTP